MAIISFENLIPEGETGVDITFTYRHLNWQVFGSVNEEYLEKIVGSSNAIRTGEAAGITFKPPGLESGFESPDSTDYFDLNSGYFTASTERILRSRCSGSMTARG